MTEEQRIKQEEDELERKRKRQDIENWYNRAGRSDRADIDYDNSQLSQNKSWLLSQDATPGKSKNQYFLTNILTDAVNDREQTESRLTSVFD